MKIMKSNTESSEALWINPTSGLNMELQQFVKLLKRLDKTSQVVSFT